MANPDLWSEISDNVSLGNSESPLICNSGFKKKASLLPSSEDESVTFPVFVAFPENQSI